MRTINDHIINPANDRITVTVLDEPGHGGASHVYAVDTAEDVHRYGRPVTDTGTTHGPGSCLISFQNGPIAEHGVNGVTQEVLMAICIDRLRSFQKGPYACRENAIALTKLEESLMWLQRRTIERMRRGVEGTHQK